MKMDEEELRELMRLRSARSEAGAAGCLAPDVLVSLSLGELAPEERRRAAAHLVECEDCARELRLIESLKPWAERAGAAHPEARPQGAAPIIALGRSGGSRRTAARGLALAASLVVAAGLALLLWPADPPIEPGPSVLRGEATPAAGIRPGDGVRLAGPPERLEWQPVPGASGYEVVLYDAQMTRLWQQPGLAAPLAELPAELRGRLERGRRYYWAVLTRTEAGSLQSPLYRFEIGP
jgi:hypothetical protein